MPKMKTHKRGSQKIFLTKSGKVKRQKHIRVIF